MQVKARELEMYTADFRRKLNNTEFHFSSFERCAYNKKKNCGNFF